MAVELPAPGIEVIQEFRTVSPTIITPALQPNIVGVGKQVIDLLVSDGAGGSELNTDALISLYGGFIAKAATGVPPAYGGLDGKALVVAVNNGPDVTVTFAGASLTPASVVDQINTAFATAGVVLMLAETVGDDQVHVRTVGVGEFQFIDVKSGTAVEVADAFEIGIGQRYAGLSSYNQYIVDIPEIAFPDPRGNLAELAIEAASIRVFLGLGNGGFREATRNSAFLRNGEVNDEAATTEGSVNLVTVGYPLVTTETLILAADGGANQTVTFATPANAAALLAAITAQTTGLTPSLGTGTPSGLVLTSDTVGASGSIEIVGGTALGLLGIGAELILGSSISAVDDGDGDQITSLVDFAGLTPESFTTAPTAAEVIGTAPGPLTADGILRLSDGGQPQNIALANTDTAAQVFAKINEVMEPARGGRITASLDGPNVKLTHSLSGTDSFIQILTGSTAQVLTDLGLSVGITRGVVSLAEPGDELWIDGAYVGEVSEVAPGGITDRLKVAANLNVTTNLGRYYYIIAKNLPGTAPRPEADLIVRSNGDVQVKQEQLRDVEGNTVSNIAALYLTYTAVRLDVTSMAAQRGLLRFDDTTQLEEALSPINAENPLALGLYFALLNAPSIQITGLGVDEISADSPFGTVEAFTRAAEYLEAFEIYSIAPLTHDQTVHQLFGVHATAMSEPEAKGERVALVNQVIPTHRLDDLVASGTDGETVGAGGLTFDTKISNLTALIMESGVSPIGTIPVSEGLFLDIGSDAKNYSIASIAGSIPTIRTTFAAGENDDGFYATTDLNDPPLPPQLIDESFSIKVRGAALATAAGPDNTGIAETVASIGRSYGNRRLWMTVPDSCAATIEGSEQLIEGFYMNAALSGMIGQNPPQQSFTNFPIAGFTRVIGSSDTFTARQMNQMAAGGAWIVVQESEGAALFSRMALTTDLTSIETRTDSITKVVDYVAKFLRGGLRNFIGRFNINQGFLDSLGSVIQGLGGLLVETGVLIGFHLNNIIQDEDAPDTVLVDVTLDVPYPCNYIRLTLVI